MTNDNVFGLCDARTVGSSSDRLLCGNSKHVTLRAL